MFIVTLESGAVYQKRVASAGEVFSAGIIGTVHFGLGNATKITSVEVKWRNGKSVLLTDINANSTVSTDEPGV
ncbi:ASPIC/UnbV domain-containing protein [Colwellia sp. E2M01]|uniref:ASPIC/UnbV domain-containing protein n=1 Tax=Colwellia sp. E2M01 TaxID=2841561 RepID=UPI001C092162|nr:ASPIC/UnbV domain-containing protein [Colwellia sp. E2M01]MBU2872052.1 ASPIC/UnbV domain-containing protein [Colwellia sp. E2M01]